MEQSVIFVESGWQFFNSVLKIFNIVDFPYVPGLEEKKKIDQDNPLTAQWRYTYSGIGAIVLIPFAYQRSLGTLRYFSFLIFGCILYTILVRITIIKVTIAESPYYREAFHNKEEYRVVWMEDYEIKWFQGLGTLMLSFECQAFFFYVRGELMYKSERRVKKLASSIVAIVCLVFILICVAAYVSLGKNLMPELYTLRIPISKLKSSQVQSLKILPCEER